MELHIDLNQIQQALGVFSQFPVLIVLVGGMFLGICFSQWVKLGYLAANDGKITAKLP